MDPDLLVSAMTGEEHLDVFLVADQRECGGVGVQGLVRTSQSLKDLLVERRGRVRARP